MPLRLDGSVVHLEGACRVEDAEPLLALLQADSGRMVDLTGAGHLHAALVQVLLALRPVTRGWSRDPFVRDWIQPLMTQAQTGESVPAFPK